MMKNCNYIIIFIICIIFGLVLCTHNVMINRIFVINLDKDTKRFELILHQLNKYRIAGERFAAIDGYNLEIQDAVTGEFLSIKNKNNLSEFLSNTSSKHYNVFLNNDKLIEIDANEHNYTIEEIGTICSHRQVWQQVIANKYETAVILEDNVTFVSEFMDNIISYLNDLPEDWEIAILGSLRPNNELGFCVGDVFRDFDKVLGHSLVVQILPTNLISGMFGYIVNKQGAQKLLELTEMSKYPLDQMVFQKGGINEGKIKGYAAMKYFVCPNLDN